MVPSNASYKHAWLTDFNSSLAQSNVKDCRLLDTDPVVEPVTLDEAKGQCRVDFDDDDDIITRLIKSARRSVEMYTSLSIVPKTISTYVDLIKPLELPYGPVTSDATAIVVTASDGSVVDSAMYQIGGLDFKEIRALSIYLGATIQYDAGMTVDQIEPGLKEAILNEIAFRYEHRGDEADTRKSVNPGICEASQILAESYKRFTWL